MIPKQAVTGKKRQTGNNIKGLPQQLQCGHECFQEEFWAAHDLGLFERYSL
jgi:hypothetical protein